MQDLESIIGEKPDWYRMDASDAIAWLHSSVEGISREEATSRAETFGANEIAFRKVPAWLRFLRQFH